LEAGDADDLLPTSVGDAAGSGKPQLAMREVPLPTMSDNFSKKIVNPELAVREPTTKIIKIGNEEIEVRVLSPEEKARRRRKRNIIMVAFAMIVLSVMVLIAMQG